MSSQPQSKPSGSVIFFEIGGALCLVFVIVMYLLMQKAGQRKECFSGTTLGDSWFMPYMGVATDHRDEPFLVQASNENAQPSVVVTNPSNEPLYSLEKIPGLPAARQKVWTDALGIPIPREIDVNAKVISNTVLYPSTYGTSEVRWSLAQYKQGLVLSAEYFFEDQNRYENDRPANIALPQPQSHDLLLLYDGRFISFTTTLTYSLNTSYNRKQAQPNPRNLPDCSSLGDGSFSGLAYFVPMVFCIGGYVATLVLFLVIVWVRNVWQKK